MGVLVAHAAAGFLAQIAPDLRHITPERFAAHDFRSPWARQVDIYDAFHFAGPVRHHQNAVGHLYRFGDVVRDQERRLLQLLLDLQHLIAEQKSSLLVERGEGFVHQQDFWLGGERSRQRHALAHAAGELPRISVLETGQADQTDEVLGAFDARFLRHAYEFEREGDIVGDAAPGKRGFLLEHHADRFMRTANGLAGDADRALIVAEQPADHIEQSRLAAAGRADHR